jgi:AcrR family transcriptional regulator
MPREKRPRKKPAGDYHHGNLSRALLDAALRVVSQKDLRELSMRELARMVGVSPRAPYRHFVSKEALLAALAVEGFDLFRIQCRSQIEAAGNDPLARMMASAQASVAFAVEHPAYFKVMYSPYETVDESTPELVRARWEPARLLLALIADAQKAGMVRAGDPGPISFAAFAIVHGLSVLLTEKQLKRFGTDKDPPELVTMAITIMYEGLKPQVP